MCRLMYVNMKFEVLHDKVKPILSCQKTTITKNAEFFDKSRKTVVSRSAH